MSIPRAKGINTRYDPLMAVRDAARVSPVLRWPMLVGASQCWPVRTALQHYSRTSCDATTMQPDATKHDSIAQPSSSRPSIPLSAFGAIRPFIIYVLIYYNRSALT